MLQTEIELRIELFDEGDAATLEEQTALVRRDLLKLAVERVESPPSRPAPQNARSGGATEVGILLVSLASSPQLLKGVFGVLQAWVEGLAKRKVRVELDGDAIEIAGATRAERRKLVDDWINSHGPH